MRYLKLILCILFSSQIFAQEVNEVEFTHLNFRDGEIQAAIPTALFTQMSNSRYTTGHAYPDGSWHVFLSGMFAIKNKEKENKQFWGANYSIQVYDFAQYKAYWTTHTPLPDPYNTYASVKTTWDEPRPLFYAASFTDESFPLSDTAYSINGTEYYTTASVGFSKAYRCFFKKSAPTVAELSVTHYIRRGNKILVYNFWNWGIDPIELNNWLEIVQDSISTIQWKGVTNKSS